MHRESQSQLLSITSDDSGVLLDVGTLLVFLTIQLPRAVRRETDERNREDREVGRDGLEGDVPHGPASGVLDEEGSLPTNQQVHVQRLGDGNAYLVRLVRDGEVPNLVDERQPLVRDK